MQTYESRNYMKFAKNESPISVRGMWITAILITLVAALFRMYKLGAWSFWVDEMFTLKDALDPAMRYHGMTYPLSYMLIGSAAHLLGVSEWSVRLVPALFGIATPVMVYLLGRKSFGDTTAILAALIIALSPWHIYWSQMARFYTMTVFFSTASLLVFHRALEKNSGKSAAWAGVLMVLGTLSHYSALLILSSVLIYMFALRKLRWPTPQGLTGRNILIYIGPFVFGALVFGAKGLSLLMRYANGHPTGTNISNPIVGAAYVIFSVIYRADVAVSLLAAAAIYFGFTRRDRTTLLLTSAVVVPTLFLAVSGAMSHAENRYAFVILPAVAILAGSTLARIWNIMKLRSAVLAVTAVLAITSPLLLHDMSYFGSTSKGERWDYRSAANYLKEAAHPNETVYSAMWFSLDYYLKHSGIPVKDMDFRLKQGKGPAVGSWLVIEDSTRGSSAPGHMRGWISDHCALKAHFTACSPVADFGLSVYQVTKPTK